MLKGVSKLLSGDILKILSDMGHGDELVIADANFPAETYAKRLVRLPGVNTTDLLDAVCKLMPLDTYTDYPVKVLNLTPGDIASGMKTPETWKEYADVLKKEYGDDVELYKIERQDFYEKTKDAFAVIQTGEERQYGDILLVKGVVY